MINDLERKISNSKITRTIGIVLLTTTLVGYTANAQHKMSGNHMNQGKHHEMHQMYQQHMIGQEGYQNMDMEKMCGMMQNDGSNSTENMMKNMMKNKEHTQEDMMKHHKMIHQQMNPDNPGYHKSSEYMGKMHKGHSGHDYK